MAKACRDHVLDQGPKGTTGHTGSDGSTSWSRTARYGTRTGRGECIAYGQKTGIGVVMRLLVNDGVASRAHRKMITDPDHKVVGNFSGPHKEYGMMTTQDFASAFSKEFMPSKEEEDQQSIAAGGYNLPSDVSIVDQAIFAETNKLRKDPKSFIPYLKSRLTYFKGNTYYTPGVESGESTDEGPAAVQEAITFLENMQPVGELAWSPGIAKACQDHVID